MTDILEIAGMTEDEDVRKLHTRLAAEAKAGDLIGSIVVSFYAKGKARKRFYLSVVGWPAKDPLLTAGVMGSCQFLVQEHALQSAGLIK